MAKRPTLSKSNSSKKLKTKIILTIGQPRTLKNMQMFLPLQINKMKRKMLAMSKKRAVVGGR
jgi:hypothetical protein